MKVKLFLIIPIFTALVACQDEQAKNIPTTTTAPHAATNTTAVMANPAPASTVAVTKPAVQHNVQDLQNNSAQAKQLAAVAVAQLIDTPPASHEAEAVKVVEPKKAVKIAKPVMVVKTIEVAKPVNVAKSVAIAEPIEAVKATIPTPQHVATGDIAKGKSLARKCMTCHNFTDRKKVGPGLKAIVGRQAGVMTGMKYSKTLAAGGWAWNEQNLAVWLCDSKKAVKALSGDASGKTKMPSQRICDATKQANIIAFLKTL